MGYGDDIMAAAEARKLKALHPHAKIIVGDGEAEYWSPVFDRNPNLSRLAEVTPQDKVLWLKNYPGCRPYLDYSKCDPDMAYQQFFTDYRVSPGELYLDPEMLEEAAQCLSHLPQGKPRIFIEPNVEFGPNKDWGFDRWWDTVELLKPDCALVQPIYSEAKVLRDVTAVKSKDFMFACALLKHCDLFLGGEGGLHHAAAALGTGAVVIFGGRIHPKTTGYDFHTNLYVDDPQSPCGMIAPCPHCRACLDQITIDHVVEAVRLRLQNPTTQVQHS